MNSSSAWTKEEDMIILNAVAAATNSSSLADQGQKGQQQQPFTHWSKLATDQRLTGRTGKAIHHRWVNYLNPNLKNHLYQPFSDDDDLKLWEAQKRIGRKWTQISIECFHSTRSGNQIKNRWESAGFRKFINKKFNNANTYSDENNNINYNSTINSNSNKRKSDDDNDDGGDDDDDDDDDNDNGDSGDDDDDDDDDDSDNNFDDDISFDSSDDEAIIYRMKMAEKRNEKKKKKRKRIIEKETETETETEIEMEIEIDMEGKKRREEEKEKQAKAENDDTAAEEERKLPQQRQRQRRRRKLPMVALTQKKNKNENTNQNMGEEQTGRQKQALLPSSSSWTEEEDTIIFNNHLNPNLNHQPFSNNDDIILWEAQKRLGKKWVQISTDFFHSTRSESQIKNRWYSSTFRNFIYKQKKCGTPLKKKEEQKENRMLKEMEKEDKQIKRKNDTADDAAETEGRQRRLVAALACRKKEGDDEDEDEDADQPPAYDYDNTNSNNDDDDDDDDTDDDSHTDFDPRQVPPPSTRTRSRSVIENDKGNKKGDELEHSNRKRSRDERDEKESSDYVDDDSDYVYDDSDMDEDDDDDEEEQQPKRHAVNASSSSSSRGGNNKNASSSSSSSSSSCSNSSLLKKSKIDNTTSVVETKNSTVTRRPNHHRRRGLPLRQRQHSRQIATVQARSTIEKDKGDNKPNHTTTRRNDSNDRIDDEEESCDDNSDDDDYGNGNDDDQNVDSKPPAARGKKGRLKSWPEMYQKLVTYKEQHKNTNVSTRDKIDPQLGSWVMTQRTNYKYNELLPGRLTLLNSIGFEWKLKETDNNKLWMDMFQKLVTYKEQHNNTMVTKQKDPKLGPWVLLQRIKYKNDKLLPNRIDLLNSINFEWRKYKRARATEQRKWMDMYQKLIAYKEQHKNTMVPRQYKKDPILGNWVRTQRTNYYKYNELLPGRLTLLNSIGFEWKLKETGNNKLWMDMFKKLVTYKEQHNNTNVSTRVKKDPKLGPWVSLQRNKYRNDKLLPNRIDLLNSINFEWRKYKRATDQKKWMDMYQKLISYKEQHKNTMVPRQYKKDPSLGHWVMTQRNNYRNDKLLPNRIDLLNSIDFHLEGVKAWKEQTTLRPHTRQRLIDTQSRSLVEKDKGDNNGDPTINRNGSNDRVDDEDESYYDNSDDDDEEDEEEEEKFLPQDNTSLRSHHNEDSKPAAVRRKSRQNKARIKLNANDRIYDDEEESYNDNSDDEEEEFLPQDSTSLRSHHNVDSKPAVVRGKRRQKKAKIELNANDRIYDDEDDNSDDDDNDDDQNVDSKPPAAIGKRRRTKAQDKKWMDMYQKLIAYKEQHKNTMVPVHYNEDPKLGLWVSEQRQRYKNDMLPLNRIDLLNSIGYEWKGAKSTKAQDKKWMDMYRKLIAYKEQHTNTMVPVHYNEDPKLGSWVSEQRQRYKNDMLPLNRIDLLNSIGFEWKGAKSGGQKAAKFQNIWMVMFQKLVAYKKQHTNTMVPKKKLKLFLWIAKQRNYYRKEKLLPNRIDLLNSIDFEWEVCREATDQRKWMDMYQKLIAYKEQHKNTMVPVHYNEDPKLGRWVSKQRKFYKNDTLLPNRINFLNSIDFYWDASISPNDHINWMVMFQKLVAYKKQHTNTMVPVLYEEDPKGPKLGQWVTKQRQYYKKDKLIPNRVDLLNSLDFDWDPTKSGRPKSNDSPKKMDDHVSKTRSSKRTTPKQYYGTIVSI